MPDTMYADCDGLSIAYQVMGDGPVDVVMIPGIFSHLELYHEFPEYSEFYRKLSAFSRVIAFDKRGQGLSDRIEGVPTFEERADDLIAVMNATGSKNAALFGLSEGAAMALLFAASHPSMVSHVITFGGYAKSCAGPDYPHMPSREDRIHKINAQIDEWGKGSSLGVFVPALGDSDAAKRVFGKVERGSCTPSAMRRYFEMNLDIDVRDVLPSVQVPTLVMYHENDRQVPFACSEYIAAHVPNAKIVNCGTGGHYYWSANIDCIVSEIECFLIGSQPLPQGVERELATVLFTDIVNSSVLLSGLGDARWRSTIERHDEEAADLIELYRGRLIKSTGDGLLATFDGPGRAVRCAWTFMRRAENLGLAIRAGLHTGEIEIMDNDISGVAVHAAARIEEAAGPSEVLVSRTVVDLMAGSDRVKFADLGVHDLKGIPGDWRLFKAEI
jgi:class 3 adenylate cyclase/pimeloyl-ACP methyl ester carboxylesterase